MGLARRRLTPDFTFFIFFWRGHELRQLHMIYACTTFGLLVFFPGVFFYSRVTGACPMTTDLIMRVNVRTTTTTTTTAAAAVSQHYTWCITDSNEAAVPYRANRDKCHIRHDRRFGNNAARQPANINKKQTQGKQKGTRLPGRKTQPHILSKVFR